MMFTHSFIRSLFKGKKIDFYIVKTLFVICLDCFAICRENKLARRKPIFSSLRMLGVGCLIAQYMCVGSESRRALKNTTVWL